MNVTVISLRDLLKYLVVLITSIMVIVTSTRFFYNKTSTIEKENITNEKSIFLTCLKVIVPMIGYRQEGTIEVANFDNIKKSNILTKLLDMELGLIGNIKNEEVTEIVTDNNQENPNTENQEENNNQPNEIDLAKTDVTTKEVTENNIKPSYTDSIDGIEVKNQSKYEVTSDLINSQFNLSNKKDIIIFHTHTCESYTQTENFSYTPSGNFRTTDLRYSVAGVGDELDKQLTAYGYNIIHDTTYHDYPAYTGSYDRSLNTVKTILNDNPGAEVVIDLHRDAVGSSSEYAPSVMIGDEKAAQLMLVIGTDGGGLYHPNCRENFKLAVAIQRKANERFAW